MYNIENREWPVNEASNTHSDDALKKASQMAQFYQLFIPAPD